jgi:hypothetical protein
MLFWSRLYFRASAATIPSGRSDETWEGLAFGGCVECVMQIVESNRASRGGAELRRRSRRSLVPVPEIELRATRDSSKERERTMATGRLDPRFAEQCRGATQSDGEVCESR